MIMITDGGGGMKKLLKNRIFIGTIITLVIFALIFLFLYSAFGNDLFGGTAEIFSKIAATGIHWWFLAIVAVGLTFALLILFVFPFLAYIISKFGTYLSLFFICLVENYSCKTPRAPLASIKGVRNCPDLKIEAKDYKLFVHFIDIPLGFRKSVTIVDENNYVVSSTAQKGVKRIGGGPPGGKFGGGQTTAFYGREREASNENTKCKSIPDFEYGDNEFHYIVVTPAYVDTKVVVGNGAKDISAETQVGKVTVCKYKTLKKRLKNQLYTPMNNSK